MAKDGRLAGRVAVITGASRGIGRAVALAYGREGAGGLVLAARDAGALDAVAAEAGRDGTRVVAVPTDVTSDADVERLAQRAVEAFGFVDVVVNNAGRYGPKRFLDYSMDEWRSFLDVNLLGTVRVTRAFLPAMVDAGRGKVVNVASTAGKYGSLYQSPYNASKHAVVGLTRCLALETARAGVQVNAICPGFVATDMVDEAQAAFADLLGVPAEGVRPALLSRVPQGRLLEPEEVAHLAVYLGSSESDSMTGIAVTLAGGLLLI